MVAVLGSLALVGATVPAQADDTPSGVSSDFTVGNHDVSRLDVSFGTPRGGITHWRIGTSTTRSLTRRRTDYLVPVTWAGVRVPHAAASGDGGFTFVTVRSVSVANAPTAKELGDLVAGRGIQTAPQVLRSPAPMSNANVRWLMPTPPVPPAVGPRVKVATFNIRDSYFRDRGAKSWSSRRKHVVTDVRSADAGVLMLQESGGPARFSKRSGKNWRQYADVEKRLGKAWDPVFRDVYESRGKGKRKSRKGFRYNQQGVRILYRKDRYKRLKRGWSPMPHRNRKQMFPTPWVVLRDRASGAEFVAISVHLAAGTNRTAWALRQKQADWVASLAASVSGGRPVVLAGDMNNTNAASYDLDAPEVLARRGFADAASAQVRKNLNYPTGGGFDRQSLTPNWPIRIDSIHVLNGVGGAHSYTNHVRFRHQPIASDHFMQSAVIPLRNG